MEFSPFRPSVTLVAVAAVIVWLFIFLTKKKYPFLTGCSDDPSLDAKQEPFYTRINAMPDNTEKILAGLRLLTEEGAQHNFVTFYANKSKDYFVQCLGQWGKPECYCEVPSNSNLQPTYRLTDDQIDKLKSLGWNPPGAEEPEAEFTQNFYRKWEKIDENVARDILQVLKVYGYSEGQPLPVEIVLE